VGITRSGVQLSDSALFPSIIKASSQISFQQGQLMHACSIKRGYDAFSSAGNSILDFYMKWGAPNLALSVFNSMSNRDSVSWNIVIHGHLDHGALEAGLRLFVQARVSGFEPNVSTLVFVAQAYRGLYDFGGGQKLHEYVFKSGFLGIVSLQNSLLSMYASFDVQIAHQLFDEMRERDVISWSLMIGAYVHNEEPLLALQMFKDMRVEPDGLTVVSALRACGNLDNTSTGRSLHAGVVSRGHDGDLFVANSLIDMYSRFKDPISALRVFNEMGIKNVVSWNCVLSGLVHNEMHQEALRLANSMLKTEVETDEVTLVNLLQLCKHFSAANQCKLIHCRVIRCSYDSNPLVLSSLIDAYAKCNLIEHAWSLFRRTEKRDTVMWATMIGGFVHGGLPDEAVAVCRQMSEIGERITNPVVMLNLTEACSLSTELKKSKWAHGIAIRSGLAADISVGTAIVDMYSKCGAVEAARRAFDHLPQKNIMSWSAMISACGMNGQAQDALALATEMKLHGLKPNAVTALSVLAACSHGGLISSGLSFFKEMAQDLSMKPSLEHYACVIDMLSKAGELDDAMDLIKAMPENFKGEASIWGAVLSASARFRRPEIGEGAAFRVLELEPFDSAGYLLTSSLHAATGSWVDAGKMRRLVKERRIRVTAGYSLVNVGDQSVKFLAGDRSKLQAIHSGSIIEQLHKFMQIDENFDTLLNDEGYC